MGRTIPRPNLGEKGLWPPPITHPPAAPTEPPGDRPPRMNRPRRLTELYASCH